MTAPPPDSTAPRPLALIRLWYAVGAVMLLVVALLSLLPLPDVGIDMQVNDKFAHLFTYFLLAGWFGLLARAWRNLVPILGGLLAYGVFIEFLQGQTGYRYAEWGDVIANGGGCLAGAALYFTPLRRLLHAIDAWLASNLK